jgi:Fic family protein
MENNMRSGKYLKDKDGLIAFYPSPLPPDPKIVYDKEMIDLISKAERSLGRLDGITETLPNPDLFIAMYVKQEATLSSQIEGTQASLVDVLEYEAAEVNDDRVPDVKEIINYVSAMNYGLAEVKVRDITIDLLNEIHKKLLINTRGGDKEPGKLRNVQNWIGPPGCDIFNATYIPPPPSEINKSLTELFLFIRENKDYPELLKCALMHSQFETIHPYLDGNGRMGRLLITFIMCKEKVISQPILYLSLFFKRYRSQYYKVLQGVRDEGDWETWIKFFLKGISVISEEAVETAKNISKLKDYQQEIITQNIRGNSHALLLLDQLYKTPFIKINQAEKYLEISNVSANKLITKLERLGIIIEITGQKRNRIYQNRRYTDLFPE